MAEAMNLIHAGTFPGGLLPENRPTNYDLEFNSHAMGFR
jgi:hypothetical protein